MVFDKIKDIIVEQLDVEEDAVTMEASITEDLGADSLDVVDLVMSIEESFDVEIPDEEVENIKTVGDIVKYIENKVEEELGPEKMAKIDVPTFRKICREYAEKQVDGQRKGFKRLGVSGDWGNPYLTFNPEYEAGNIEVFKDLYLSGAIYRGRKPIHWCTHCHTALAEAEIEYADEITLGRSIINRTEFNLTSSNS